MWRCSVAFSAAITSSTLILRSMWTSTTTATVMMARLSSTPIRFQPIEFWKNRATARSELSIFPPVWHPISGLPEIGFVDAQVGYSRHAVVPRPRDPATPRAITARFLPTSRTLPSARVDCHCPRRFASVHGKWPLGSIKADWRTSHEQDRSFLAPPHGTPGGRYRYGGRPVGGLFR